MMKRFLALSVLALSLAACEPPGPSQYVLGMMHYQGQSEAKVVDDLGPPDRTYEVEGVKYLTYTKASQQIFSNGPDFGYGVEPRSGVLLGQSFNDSATIQTYRCDVFFAIRNKQVTKVGYRGNAC